jgi:hypothetical protein
MADTVVVLLCCFLIISVMIIVVFIWLRSRDQPQVEKSQPNVEKKQTIAPESVSSGIEKHIPRSLWMTMVAPSPDKDIDVSERPYFSSYDLFLKACSRYPKFGTHEDSVIARREIAAFFGNLKQETHFVINREQSCLNNPCDWISSPQKSPVCNGSWSQCAFYGRGPIQLTHYSNYENFSQKVYKNDSLLKDPDLVAKKADIGWESAFFFWFENGIHDAMTQSRTAPFKITIQKINGTLECNKETPGGNNRVRYFKEYCQLLGVDPGPDGDLKCW